jgi:hypothetical protein
MVSWDLHRSAIRDRIAASQAEIVIRLQSSLRSGRVALSLFESMTTLNDEVHRTSA